MDAEVRSNVTTARRQGLAIASLVIGVISLTALVTIRVHQSGSSTGDVVLIKTAGPAR